jgi:hypothetical protein
MQAHPRLDAEPQQLVDEPIVKIEPLRVRRTPPMRLHAWPGDREPVGTCAEFVQERQVLAPAMIVVTRDFSRGAVLHMTGLPAKAVPYAGPAPVHIQCTFDLVRAGRHAPDETFGENQALRRREEHLEAPRLLRSDLLRLPHLVGSASRIPKVCFVWSVCHPSAGVDAVAPAATMEGNRVR